MRALLWRSCTQRAAEAFMASAQKVRKRGLSPARTARIITSQLRGLTHVQGVVCAIGWLARSHPFVVRGPMSDHGTAVAPPIIPRVTAVFEAGHCLGIERHRLFAQCSARCCRCGEPASGGSPIKTSLPQCRTHGSLRFA